MILDHDLISQRYFFPRREAPAEPFWVPCAAGRLACRYLRVHGGDAPVLIHFHGNGEVVADYAGLDEVWAAMGVDVFLAEYRGYGASDGEPRLAAMLADTAAVFEALGVPQEQVFVFGRSVGSIYAIEFAHRFPNIRGLILESGIALPLQRLLVRVSPEELGTTMAVIEAEVAEHVDHQSKLGSYTGRLLVLHARNDQLVTVDHAERNHAWAASADKQLVVFDRGDHNTIFSANHQAYLEALRAFLAGSGD